MLFILNSTIQNINPESEVQCRSLCSLLMAYQSGHHMLFIEMDDLRILRERLGKSLGIAGEKALQSLYNKLPTFKAVVSQVSSAVIVHIDENEGAVPIKKEGSWYVPITYFAPGVLQSVILGENDRDAELYIQLAKQYRDEKKIFGYHPAARPRSGGGSGIVKVLENYIASEVSPCLCITDSDKFYPGSGKSTAVRGCEELSQTNTRILEYLLLEEREIENFLPKSLLERANPDFEYFVEKVNSIKGYKHDMWSYLDLKEGIKLDWIQKRDAPTQEYWSCVKEHLEQQRAKCNKCKNTSGVNCTCCMITGIGDKVLDKCINFLQNNPPRLKKGVFQSDTRWHAVGKLAFSFLIAPSGENARVRA